MKAFVGRLPAAGRAVTPGPCSRVGLCAVVQSRRAVRAGDRGVQYHEEVWYSEGLCGDG